MAADLHRVGDHRCDWMLERAAAGDIFAAGHGEAGNDLPLFLSTLDGRARSTAAGRSPATRSSAACRRCGRGSASTPWTPPTPTTRRSSTASCTATPPATRSSRPGTRSACGPRSPTTPSSTARSSPDDATRVVCAGRHRRRRAVPRRDLRLGAARLRRRLRRHRPAGARRHRRPHARAHVDRADPLDGLPPRGAAPRGRDAHGHRGDRLRASTGSPPTGAPASTTRGLADQDRGDEVHVVNKACDDRRHAPSTSPAASGIFKRSRLEQLFRDCRLGRIHPANTCSPTSSSAS